MNVSVWSATFTLFYKYFVAVGQMSNGGGSLKLLRQDRFL